MQGVVRSATRRGAPNSAPSQWGRRLARVVGERYGVVMVANHARNEGRWQNIEVVIKCAKSTSPPVSVLLSMLDRLDEVWAVFLLPSGEAEVWRLSVGRLRRHGHFTRGGKSPARVEIKRRAVAQSGTLLGILEAEAVEACYIP